MFELPSIWNLIISTIVFFIAAAYAHRYLEEQGIPKGFTRGVLVFLFASLVSWSAGAVVDKLQGRSEAVTPAVQNPDEAVELLKALNQQQ